jgi:cell division protein FtsB
MRLTEQIYRQQTLLNELAKEEEKVYEQYTRQFNELCEEISCCIPRVHDKKNQDEKKLKELLERKDCCQAEMKELNDQFNSQHEFLKERSREETCRLQELITLLELSESFEKLIVK